MISQMRINKLLYLCLKIIFRTILKFQVFGSEVTLWPMLIWITAPSATIGIFALLVLLSAIPSEGAAIPTTLDATTVEDSDSENLRISDLPFANYILTPCNPGTSRNYNRGRTQTELHVYAIAFYRYMAAYSTLYKQDSQRVANESTMNDCGFLNLPTIANTPNLSELMELDAEAALKQIHSSLLLHAAYAYFVDHQFEALSGSCSESGIDREQKLAREALVLARKQRHMACMTQITMEELGFTLNATNSLQKERLTNLSVCSRRALRDCQVMLSITHLLDVIGKYSKSMLQSMDNN